MATRGRYMGRPAFRLERLAPHFPSLDVRRVRLRWMPWWLRPFVRPQMAAITLGRSVYFRPGTRIDARLVAHELVHIEQQQREGLFRHAARYLREYARLRRRLDAMAAYRAISYEEEARLRAEEIVRTV